MIMKLLATILFFFLFLTGAFSQTRNVLVNTSSVVVQPTNFWSADASNARTGLGLAAYATNPIVPITNGGTGANNITNARANLGLGSAATNPASAFQPSSSVLTNLASSNAINLTNISATNIVGTVALSLGGTGATNAAGARTNLGLGWSALTNTNAVNFRNAISAQEVLTLENGSVGRTWADGSFVAFGAMGLYVGAGLTNIDDSEQDALGTALLFYTLTNLITEYGTISGTWFVHESDKFRSAIGLSSNLNSFWTATNTAGARTNLGLGWSALTNSNSGISLVSVDTNGSVVSPTNFWQQAPIQTLVQTFIPTVSSNSYGTNARNLYVYSMATAISGVTNTVILPTNSATFDGDVATVTHKGTTSSVTAVRQAGSATNFTTISNEDESVKFIREGGQWTFYHNISYVEPIRFTDGNIEANKAASRTNLGLGFAALTNTNAAGFQRAIFSTNSVPSNSANINTINFNTAVAWMEVSVITNGATNSYRIPLFQ